MTSSFSFKISYKDLNSFRPFLRKDKIKGESVNEKLSCIWVKVEDNVLDIFSSDMRIAKLRQTKVEADGVSNKWAIPFQVIKLSRRL